VKCGVRAKEVSTPPGFSFQENLLLKWLVGRHSKFRRPKNYNYPPKVWHLLRCQLRMFAIQDIALWFAIIGIERWFISAQIPFRPVNRNGEVLEDGDE